MRAVKKTAKAKIRIRMYQHREKDWCKDGRSRGRARGMLDGYMLKSEVQALLLVLLHCLSHSSTGTCEVEAPKFEM